MEQINNMAVQLTEFLSRAGFERESNLGEYLQQVCSQAGLGKVSKFGVVDTGFEDLNTWVAVDSGKFFIKSLQVLEILKLVMRLTDGSRSTIRFKIRVWRLCQLLSLKVGDCLK